MEVRRGRVGVNYELDRARVDFHPQSLRNEGTRMIEEFAGEFAEEIRRPLAWIDPGTAAATSTYAWQTHAQITLSHARWPDDYDLMTA